MEQTPELQALIAKYQRSHWEFEALNLDDINERRSDGDALVHLVAFVGGPDELDLLVRSGAKVNAIGDMGYIPLHYAAMDGRLKVAEKRLALGADPEIRDEFGTTPAETALIHEHKDVAKILKRNRYYK